MNANVTPFNRARRDLREAGAEGAEALLDIPDESIDLAGVIAMIRRRIHIIIGLMALVVAVTTVYSFTVTPRYTATVQLLLEQREKNVLEQESVAAGLPAENNAVDTEVEVLKSPALAIRVIDAFDLHNDPELNPPDDRGVLSLLAAPLKAIVAATSPESVSSGIHTTAAEMKTRNDVLKAFEKRTAVKRVGLTYVVEVSFSSEDPTKATRIADMRDTARAAKAISAS